MNTCLQCHEPVKWNPRSLVCKKCLDKRLEKQHNINFTEDRTV